MDCALQIWARQKKSVHSTVNHCNQAHSYPTAFLKCDCSYKCSRKTINLKYSDLLYHLHFSIVLFMVNNCACYSKPFYFRFTVFTCVFTVISLYIFAVHSSAGRIVLTIFMLLWDAVLFFAITIHTWIDRHEQTN